MVFEAAVTVMGRDETVNNALPSLVALPQALVTIQRYILPLIETVGLVNVNIAVVAFE